MFVADHTNIPVTQDLIQYLEEINKPQTARWLIEHPEVTYVQQHQPRMDSRCLLSVRGMPANFSEYDRMVDQPDYGVMVLTNSVILGMSSPGRHKPQVRLKSRWLGEFREAHVDVWLWPFHHETDASERVGTLTILKREAYMLTCELDGQTFVKDVDDLIVNDFFIWLTDAEWSRLRRLGVTALEKVGAWHTDNDDSAG